jgi:predicted DNA-binding transcriptional regulator YafY
VQDWAELLLFAQRRRLLLRLSYHNAKHETSERDIAPYGLYLLNGQWYLVAHDMAHNALKVFALTRIQGLELQDASFELPDDFDIARWVELPFRLSGKAERDAVARLRISARSPEKPETITFGKGSLEPQEDGSWIWGIAYPSAALAKLVAYALEHGLEFEAEELAARELERATLEAVIAAHD